MIQSLASTKKQRSFSRLTALSEVVYQASKMIIPETLIPAKIGQAVLSGVGFFQKDIKLHEKITNAVLCLIALIEVGLAIYLIAQGAVCEISNIVCNLIVAAELLYNGILAVSFGASELNKQNTDLEQTLSVDNSV